MNYILMQTCLDLNTLDLKTDILKSNMDYDDAKKQLEKIVKKAKKKLKTMFNHANIEVVPGVEDEVIIEVLYNSGECFYQESYRIFNLEDYS